MPLNESQKSFIDTSIGFMFDFSSKAEFIEQARLISEAMGTEVNNSHAYYHLSQCVFHPERHLNRLHENGDVTLSELKAYLIDYIIGKLQANGSKYEYVLIPPDGNREALVRLHCPQTSASNQVFRSNAVVIEHRLPWTLPTLSGRVYTQELLIEDIINDEGGIIRQPRVKVTVTLPNLPAVTKIIDLFPIPFFSENPRENDQETDDFIRHSSMPQAEEQAREFALEKIRAAFDDGEDATVNEEEVNDAAPGDDDDGSYVNGDTDTFRDILLTHSYYFGEVYAGELGEEELEGLDQSAFDNLTNPAVISLQRHKLIDLDQASKITKPLLRMIENPVWGPKIRSGEITLPNLRQVSNQYSVFLTLPCITNLVLRNKLSFAQALRLPLHLEPLLSTARFQALFATIQIDWGQLSRLIASDIDRILAPQSAFMTPFICNGVISFNEASTMSESDILAKRFYYLSRQQPFSVNGQADSLPILTAEIERLGTLERQINTRLAVLTGVLRCLLVELDAKRRPANAPRIYYVLYDIIQNGINPRGREPQPVICLNTLEYQTDRSLQAVNTPRHYLGRQFGSNSVPAKDWLTMLKKCLTDLRLITFGQPEAVAANAANAANAATSSTSSTSASELPAAKRRRR